MIPNDETEREFTERPFYFMIRVFRLAIPEISDEALLLFVKENPYKDPGDGELVELKDYDVRGPGNTRFAFTIARKILYVDYIEPGRGLIGLSPLEVVFVFETEILEAPGGKAVIMQYEPREDKDLPSPSPSL